MAAADEGRAPYDGGAGVGGKFRKRPFKRTSTPYDRPATALLQNSNNNSISLLSKLVDPASKLLYAGAYRLFGAFRNRLTLPPPPQRPPEADVETNRRQEGTVPNMANSTIAPEPGYDQGGNLASSYVATEISDLERMLKQRSFTRSEIKRLTELLCSRTSDMPVDNEEKREEANVLSIPLNKDRNETDIMHASVSTPGVSSMVLKEDVASPAEIAKAYMGSRPSKVSPSMLGLRNRALGEDSSLLHNGSFLSQSPISLQLSLASKTTKGVGVSENVFTTPRSRGRSAIYSMARTPYSRIHSISSHKGIGSTSSGYGEPFSSLMTSQSELEWERPVGSKKMALKRRSSVLEDDIGSVGPTRRTRQKPNAQGGFLSSREREYGSNAAQYPVSTTKKLLLTNEPEYRVPNSVEESGDANVSLSRYALVPTKSSEMATKILQHLEKMSPKEKVSQSKSFPGEKSASKLTPNMLHGQALRSMDTLDSSKIFSNIEEGRNLEDLRETPLPDVRDSTMQKDNVEENGSKMFAVPLNRLTSVTSDVSGQDSGAKVKSADSSLKLPTELLQKKRAFQMSAHEDFLEMDDDIHSNGIVSTSFVEKTENLEASVIMSKDFASKGISLPNTPTLPESKTIVDSVSNQKADFRTSNGCVGSEEKAGLTFSSSPPVNTTSQPTLITESMSTVNKFVPLKEPTAAPSSINNKPIDNVQPLAVSSSFSNERSGLKRNSSSDAKIESFNSLLNGASASVTSNGQVTVPLSYKGDDNITQYGVDEIKALETLPSTGLTAKPKRDLFAFGIPTKHSNLNYTQNVIDVTGNPDSTPSSASASTTSSIFSFGAPTKHSDRNNGTLTSSPSFFSTSAPVLASSNFLNQISSNSSSVASSSSITTTTASGSGLSSSAASPIFSFVSSVTPASSVSATSTSASVFSTVSGGETTDSKPKSDQGQQFGNTISLPPFGSKESSPFGFSSPAGPSTAKNQSEGSLFSTGGGSLANAQASTAATQSVPFQFGSSATLSVFGTSATTTLAGSAFNSSGAPSANPFSSTTTIFGQSSAATSSDAISGSSSTSTIFVSGWPLPSKSSGFGSTISSPPSASFSFGGASTSVATSSNAPAMVFGSSTTSASSGSPTFSFGATATNPSFPSFSQSQSVFGNSTPGFTSPSGNNNDQMGMEDRMAEDPMHSAAPALPAFGQPPSPAPVVPAFSQQPSPGFMFGSANQTSSPSPQGIPFQFGGQPNLAIAQNLSPFQASSSLEFNAGGSFSLGSGGGDKSQRRTVRISRNKNRKK